MTRIQQALRNHHQGLFRHTSIRPTKKARLSLEALEDRSVPALVNAEMLGTTVEQGQNAQVQWSIEAGFFNAKKGYQITASDVERLRLTIDLPGITQRTIEPTLGNEVAIQTLNGKQLVIGTTVIPIPIGVGTAVRTQVFAYAELESTTQQAASTPSGRGVAVTTATNPIEELFQRTGFTEEKLREYAATLVPDLMNYATAGNIVINELAWQGVRNYDSTFGYRANWHQDFRGVVNTAFGGDVKLHGSSAWNPTKPTVILVHGIMTPRGHFETVGTALKNTLLNQGYNVLTYYWNGAFDGNFGVPGVNRVINLINGLNRRILPDLNSTDNKSIVSLANSPVVDIASLLSQVDLSDLEEYADELATDAAGKATTKLSAIVEAAKFVYTSTQTLTLALMQYAAQYDLRAAVDLHMLIKLLGNAYKSARDSKLPGALHAKDAIDIYSHSEGTVITTAALMMEAPGTHSPDYSIRRAVFLGANLDRGSAQANREIERIHPDRRKIYNVFSATDQIVALGPNSGSFVTGYGAGQYGFNGPLVSGVYQYDVSAFAIFHVDVHVPIYDEFYVGWWTWLTERNVNLFAANNFGNALQSVIDNGDADLSTGTPSANNSAPVSIIQFVDQHASALAIPGVGARGAQATTLPTRYFQGELVVVEAKQVSGPVTSVDFYVTPDTVAVPNESHYFVSDTKSQGGWKGLIHTTTLAPGTYNVFARARGPAGQTSEYKVLTFRVVPPFTPPDVLPPSLPTDIVPRYFITPNRKGDALFAAENYSLVPGNFDLWQIRPKTGGGFRFRTTGTADTVLSVYDAETGLLLQFSDGAGAGDVTLNLTADKRYLIAIALESGSGGTCGLEVTGANQVPTDTLVPTSPTYQASVVGNITKNGRIDYYDIVAPATATTLSITLRCQTSLNGYVRLEDSAGNTLTTRYTAGPGATEQIVAWPVMGGASYTITVQGVDATLGVFTLETDFSPDDSALPDQLFPIPSNPLPLVPLPDGRLSVLAQTITANAPICYYRLSATASGEYEIQTEGTLNTQLGVYLGNGTVLQRVDDGGSGRNAKLTINLTDGTDYLIAVRAESTTTGNFSLQLRGPASSVANFSPAGVESVAETGYFFLANNSRIKHFRTVVPSNATMFTLTGMRHPAWPDLDYELIVRTANGVELGRVNVNGPGGDESLTNLPVQSGQTLYITVASVNTTVGDFKLHGDFNPDFSVDSSTEFIVRSALTGTEDYPAVARNAAQQSVVVWSNRDSVAGFAVDSIRGRLIGSNDQPLGTDFAISQNNLSTLDHPYVAMADSGSFVVVWKGPTGVVYRCFAADGTPLTNELQAIDIGTGTEAKIAIRGDGVFAISWVSFDRGDPNGDIYARVFLADGTPHTNSFKVNTRVTDYQGNPDLVFTNDTSFTVVWHGYKLNNVFHIFGQEIAVSGAFIGGEFQVSPGDTTGRHFDPRIARSPDGTKYVVYVGDNRDGSGRGIYLQKMSATNALLGSDIQVNARTDGDQIEPVVAMGAQGKAMVAYSSTDTDGYGVFGRQIGPNGLPAGPELQLNQYMTDTQRYPTIASDGASGFFLAWTSTGQNFAGTAAVARRYNMPDLAEAQLSVTDSTGNAIDRYVQFSDRAANTVSEQQFVTLRNDGTAPLVVSKLELFGPSAKLFRLVDSAGFTLLPGATRQVAMQFLGAQSGAYAAALRIYHDDSASVLSGVPVPNPFWVSLGAAVPKLTITTSNPVLHEHDGLNAGSATITRSSGDLLQPLRVYLQSNKSHEVRVPVFVDIPAGESTVTVPLEAVRDSLDNKTQRVLLTATAVNFGTATLTVTTNDDDTMGRYVNALQRAPGFRVSVLHADANAAQRQFLIDDPGYLGNTIAVGDVNNDGVLDTALAVAARTGSFVKVWDGTTNSELWHLVYDTTYRGNLNIAVGDVDGDGHADIIIAPATGAPLVKLFDGATGIEFGRLFALESSFRGGVNIAVGDFDGDGRTDFVVSALSGSKLVRSFDGDTLTLIREYEAATPNFLRGVRLATGDLDGDGQAEIIVGTMDRTTFNLTAFDADSYDVLASGSISGLKVAKAKRLLYAGGNLLVL